MPPGSKESKECTQGLGQRSVQLFQTRSNKGLFVQNDDIVAGQVSAAQQHASQITRYSHQICGQNSETQVVTQQLRVTAHVQIITSRFSMQNLFVVTLNQPPGISQFLEVVQLTEHLRLQASYVVVSE
jgi:hypothetical protein